jgi:rubrerythrin
MPEGSGSVVDVPEAGSSLGAAGTGESAIGEFRCSGCGYGVMVQRQLPRCPMCSGTIWQPVSWRLLARPPMH